MDKHLRGMESVSYNSHEFMLDILANDIAEDFGYEHIAWVFSGRRGIHGWVADDGARHLQNDGRSAVVEYFSTVTGSDTSTAKVNLAYPLHPLHK